MESLKQPRKKRLRKRKPVCPSVTSSMLSLELYKKRKEKPKKLRQVPRSEDQKLLRLKIYRKGVDYDVYTILNDDLYQLKVPKGSLKPYYTDNETETTGPSLGKLYYME